MIILPSSPISKFVKGIELDGQPVNATFIDLNTGRVQFWMNGVQVEAIGTVRLLLESQRETKSLDPAMSTELDRLLEQVKQRLAEMSPQEREAMYHAQRESLVRAFSTPCEHGELDFETCPKCRAEAEAGPAKH